MRNKNLSTDIISALFVLLFVYAAVSKLADYQRFQIQLGKSPILAPFMNEVSWLIPLIEIATAGLLVSKRYQLLALYISYSMMIMFTAYIVVILNFSPYIPCSCGGILQNMNWRQHLVFNVIFVIIGCLGVVVYPTKNKKTIAIGGEAENLEQSRH